MADSQVSVGGSLTYAWALLRKNWRMIWGVLALVSLAQTIAVAGADAQNYDLLFGGLGIQLLIQPMLYAAIFRLAFADRHPADPAFAVGHSGLQWRAMEWRVLAAQLLMILFLVLIAVLGFLLVGGLALGIIASRGGAAPPSTPQAVITALGPDGWNVVLFVAALVLATLVFFNIRLFLALPATADTGKITVLGSWGLTKGHFWRILATLLLLQLPLTFLQSVLGALGEGGGSGASAVVAMSAESALFSALVIGAASGCLIAPLSAGALAYYYRNPSGPPPSVTS